MKKIISLCISLILLVSLCLTASATYTPVVCMSEDFENVGTTTTLNYFNTSPWAWNYGITHGSTTQKRSMFTFETNDGNTFLKSEGIREKYNGNKSMFYNPGYYDANAEYSINERFIHNTLKTAFDASVHTDQKLVVSYDWTVEAQGDVYNDEIFIMSLLNSTAASNGSKAEAVKPLNLHIYRTKLYVGFGGDNQRTEVTEDAAAEFNRCVVSPAEVAEGNAPQKMHVVFVIDPGVGETVYINGIKAYEGNNGTTKVARIAFVINGSINTTIDNLQAYTVSDTFEMETSSITNGSTVSADTALTFDFSNSIPAESLSTITVSKDGAALTAGKDYTASLVAGEDKLDRTVKISFPNDMMAYGADYTVTFPATFKDAAGTAISETTVSFATESLPTFSVSDLTVKSGWNGNAEVTDLATVANKMVNLSVSAQNTTGRAVPAGLFVGLYQGDVLISCGMIDKYFGVNETESFSTAMYIPADAATTDYQIKAFVCPGLADMTALGTVKTVG